MDVAIYTRVSTEEQKEYGFSLQDQERRLRQFCIQNNKNIIEHYQDDYSAKNFNRPAFQKFLNDLKSKRLKIKQLVIVRWDRFSRNAEESFKMKSILKTLGVELIFIESNLDESIPENLIPLVLQMVLPQVENERRGINTKQGMRQALREGRWVWKAPKGYKNDQINKTIVIGDDSCFVIKAFNEFSKGVKSADQIRKELVKEGFVCGKQSFLNMLRNPFYVGKIVIEEWKNDPLEIVNGIHEPIISEDVFQTVQDILSGRNRKQSKPSKIKSLFPLRGHLICPRCGNNLTASSSKGRSKKYHYYHCQNGCKERNEAEAVNNDFIRYLDSIKVNNEVSELYLEILNDVIIENEGSKELKLLEIDKKIKVLEEKLTNIDKKFVNDSISSEDYRRITGALKKEILNSIDEKKALKESNTNIINEYKYSLSFLSNIGFYYENAPIELKNKIIDSIYSEKLIYKENEFRTIKTNSLINLITSKSIDCTSIDNKKAIISDGLSSLAPLIYETSSYQPLTEYVILYRTSCK